MPIGRTGENAQRVNEVMTKNPQCVTENDDIRRVAKLMLDCDCGAIPVVQSENDKKVIGMITDRDIVVRIVATGKDASSAKVSEAMSRGAHTVREDASLDSVYSIMAKEQVRRIPVVDNDDRIIGIVAVADVANEDEADRKLAKTVEGISQGTSKN
jgi:CBS domain-containing protein